MSVPLAVSHHHSANNNSHTGVVTRLGQRAPHSAPPDKAVTGSTEIYAISDNGQQHAPGVLKYAAAGWWLPREWLCCTPCAPHPSGSPVVLRALRKPAFPAIEGGLRKGSRAIIVERPY